MKRRATIRDLPFIAKLIFDGAKHKHFDTGILAFKGKFFFLVHLYLMIHKGYGFSGGQKRLMEVFIWNKNKKPIGFVVSAKDPEELLLTAISPQHRGKGYGREMLDSFITNYIAKKEMVCARCYQESKIMRNYLLSRGFKIMDKSSSGNTFLIANYKGNS